MTRIIGFTGGMGVGKSTAIEHLNDHFATRLIKFAQPLYDVQEFIYRRISNVHPRPSTFIKDRKLLQWLGTDWGRDSISQTLWVDLWKDEANFVLENFPNQIVVCDDVRFDNEAQTIKSLGGIVVQITSTHADKRIDTKLNTHKSESGVDKKYVDFTIQNDDSVEVFRSKLNDVFKNLRKGK